MSDLLLEPWRKPIPTATVPKPIGQREAEAIADPEAIATATEKVITQRVLLETSTLIKDRRAMSLLGKLQHLTEEAQDFHKETETALDDISAKIRTGRAKREDAVKKHHAYYDAIIAGVDESTKVIDRLSNGPLSGDGEK